MTKGRRTGPPPASSSAPEPRSESGREPEVEVFEIDGPARFRGVTVDRMISFLRVYDAKGIASAAPRDPVRQSQLSRQVRELEHALDARLFERDGRGIKPTPAGVLLSATVRGFFHGLAHVADQPRPRIRLAAGGSLLRWLVLPILPIPDAPGERPVPPITVQAGDSKEILGGLEDGSLDIGILRTTEARPPLFGAVIGSVDYAWFCARSLVPEAPEPTLAALGAAAPLAQIWGESELDAMFAELGPARVSCTTFPELAELIRGGRCAGVLPTLAARELPEAEFHIVRPRAFAKYASRLVLAWRRSDVTLEPEVAYFRRYLRDALREAFERAHDAGRTAPQASTDEPAPKPRRESRKAR